MRKLGWASLLLIFVAACGDDEKGEPKNPAGTQSTCTEEGATQCDGNKLKTCVDSTWITVECTSTQKCGAVAGVSGVFACNTIGIPEPGPHPRPGTGPGPGPDPRPRPNENAGKEFGTCLPGNQCEAGLTCISGLTAEGGLCVTPCQTHTNSCGANRVCQPISETNPISGICFNQTATRDSECLINGNLCAPNQGECTAVSEEGLACKLTCDSAAIGTQGGCPANEQCLAAPGFVEPQDPAVSCVDSADCSEGYSCFTFSDNSQSCARYKGWCGTVTPMAGDFSQQGLIAHLRAGHMCNMTTEHAGCGVTGGTGAPASVDCVPITEDEEGNEIAICIGSCGDPNGGADLNCGTGYRCGRPPQNQAFFFDVQRGTNGTPVSCTQGNNAPCDTANGFTCFGPFSDGYMCSAPAKVCLTQR